MMSQQKHLVIDRCITAKSVEVIRSSHLYHAGADMLVDALCLGCCAL